MLKKNSLHMKNDKTTFNTMTKYYARNHNKQINDYSCIKYTEKNIPKFLGICQCAPFT